MEDFADLDLAYVCDGGVSIDVVVECQDLGIFQFWGEMDDVRDIGSSGRRCVRAFEMSACYEVYIGSSSSSASQSNLALITLSHSRPARVLRDYEKRTTWELRNETSRL